MSIEAVKARIIDVLKTIKDPEIPINLYDLGLIYDVDLRDDGKVEIEMTLTTPACPVAEQMPGMVQRAVEGVDGVDGVEVRLVWDPPWTADKLPEDVRFSLGLTPLEMPEKKKRRF